MTTEDLKSITVTADCLRDYLAYDPVTGVFRRKKITTTVEHVGKTMNRECNGDFFEAGGFRYYRCLWDGTVLPAPKPGELCPHCNREIEGSSIGTLEIRTRTYVVFPQGFEADLPLPQTPMAE